MSSDHKGRVIAFLGPDGAGKSTVLDIVKARLERDGRDFANYYFAPGFLKRYRPKAEVTITTNPHEGRQYGPLLIVMKIGLMLFEYRMGMPRARRKNDILLFDRHILDLLVDPKRYRMSHSRWWMRALIKLAPRPDRLIVIHAPAEIIQSRKLEVPFEECQRQVQAYQALARSFPGSILIENTGAPEDAAEAALKGVLTP